MTQQINLEQLVKDVEIKIQNFINGDTNELNITPDFHLPFMVGVVEHLFRKYDYEVDYDYITHFDGCSTVYTILYNTLLFYKNY